MRDEIDKLAERTEAVMSFFGEHGKPEYIRYTLNRYGEIVNDFYLMTTGDGDATATAHNIDEDWLDYWADRYQCRLTEFSEWLGKVEHNINKLQRAKKACYV